MHPAARIGFLYLLASAWQTDDCTISADPIDLATESGLGDELWAVHGGRILRKFKFVDGRYRNDVVLEEWSEAKTIYDKRRAGAVRTNSVRSADGERTQSERQADTQTVTGTTTKATTKTTAIAVIELPAWIDWEVWNAYLEMRKKKRAAPTDRALKGILTQLGIFRNKGHDPNAILDTSIRSNWTDVYEPKTGASNGNRNSKTAGNLDAAAQAIAFLEQADRDSQVADEIQPQPEGSYQPGDASAGRGRLIDLRSE